MHKPETTILIVDDDRDNRDMLHEALGKRGYETSLAESGEEACDRAQEREFGVIVSDIQMGALSGIEVLKWFRKHVPDTPVVLLTAFGSVEVAIDAMKHGAFDYLTKPVNLEELFLIVGRALEHARLVREHKTPETAFDRRLRSGSIVAQSRPMIEIFKLVGKTAQTKASVLIYGETGTGKELIAQALHDNSPRVAGPFVAINCAAIPENLLESELFGHVKGAFTNAEHLRRGLLEEASGGTVFFDEIGDLCPTSQAKLLRVLQEGEIRRLGSNTPIQVDLRLVSASRYNLEELVKKGKFREDLLYRLKTITIEVPPLRERKEDIPLLADLFLSRYGAHKNIRGFTAQAFELLQQHEWLGNVRELEHIIERAATLAPGPIISEDHLPLGLRDVPSAFDTTAADEAGVLVASRRKTAAITREQLLTAIEKTTGKQHAAEVLGISRWALNRLLEKHGLEARDQDS